MFLSQEEYLKRVEEELSVYINCSPSPEEISFFFNFDQYNDYENRSEILKSKLNTAYVLGNNSFSTALGRLSDRFFKAVDALYLVTDRQAILDTYYKLIIPYERMAEKNNGLSVLSEGTKAVLEKLEENEGEAICDSELSAALSELYPLFYRKALDSITDESQYFYILSAICMRLAGEDIFPKGYNKDNLQDIVDMLTSHFIIIGFKDENSEELKINNLKGTLKMNKNPAKYRVLLYFAGGSASGAASFYRAFIIGLFALNADIEIYAVINGYYGMTKKENYVLITKDNLDSIDIFLNSFCTCRDYMTKDHFDEISSVLSEMKINVILGLGGDGTARGITEYIEISREKGYLVPWIFVPASIDGIDGSDETIGKAPAAKFICDGAYNLSGNAFMTFDTKLLKHRIALVEAPGRDRDDLLFEIYEKLSQKEQHKLFGLEKTEYLLLPYNSGKEQPLEKLIDIVKNVKLSENLCIIIHEGAVMTYNGQPFKKDDGVPVSYKLAKLISEKADIKVNVFAPQHLGQTNSFQNESDAELSKGFSDKVLELFKGERLEKLISDGESLGIVKKGDEFVYADLFDICEANNNKKNTVILKSQASLNEKYKKYTLSEK